MHFNEQVVASIHKKGKSGHEKCSGNYWPLALKILPPSE